MFNFFKYIFIFLVFAFFVSVNSLVYAGTLEQDCASVNYDEPELQDIFCPIARVFSLFITVVGVVFIAFVIFGAVKLALSFGDPKGLVAAQDHWTWLFIGTGVVLGFFAIFSIAVRLFGVSPEYADPNALLNAVYQRLLALMQGAKIIK